MQQSLYSKQPLFAKFIRWPNMILFGIHEETTLNQMRETALFPSFHVSAVAFFFYVQTPV